MGLTAYPFTFPLESAVTVRPPMGPSPCILRVRRSSSPFMSHPIITLAVSSLPRAAVATGLVLWDILACSTRSLVVAAKALICPSAAVALIT